MIGGKTWEYKVVGVSRREGEDFLVYCDLLTKSLNLQGDDGWELVTVENGVAYFKRKRQR